LIAASQPKPACSERCAAGSANLSSRNRRSAISQTAMKPNHAAASHAGIMPSESTAITPVKPVRDHVAARTLATTSSTVCVLPQACARIASGMDIESAVIAARWAPSPKNLLRPCDAS
jgi:hypothetical protein